MGWTSPLRYGKYGMSLCSLQDDKKIDAHRVSAIRSSTYFGVLVNGARHTYCVLERLHLPLVLEDPPMVDSSHVAAIAKVGRHWCVTRSLLE